MEQENGNEDEIVNMSFLPKYLDWLIVQSKKKIAQQYDNDFNSLPWKCHMRDTGLDEACIQCLRNEQCHDESSTVSYDHRSYERNLSNFV